MQGPETVLPCKMRESIKPILVAMDQRNSCPVDTDHSESTQRLFHHNVDLWSSQFLVGNSIDPARLKGY